MRNGLLAVAVGSVIVGVASWVASSQPPVTAEARAAAPRAAPRFEMVGMVTNTVPFLDALHLLGRDGFRPVALKVADDAVIVDAHGAALSLAALSPGAEIRAHYELRDNYFLARHIAVLQAPARRSEVPGFGP